MPAIAPPERPLDAAKHNKRHEECVCQQDILPAFKQAINDEILMTDENNPWVECRASNAGSGSRQSSESFVGGRQHIRNQINL